MIKLRNNSKLVHVGPLLPNIGFENGVSTLEFTLKYELGFALRFKLALETLIFLATGCRKFRIGIGPGGGLGFCPPTPTPCVGLG